MLRLTCALMIAFACVAIAGCSAIERKALPAEQLASAQPLGIPGVRFWGDADGDVLAQWNKERLENQKALLVSQGIEHLPAASYLALSGGGEDGAFGAGILCGWTQHGTRPKFSVVTGVSAGALIAPFVFAGPEYDHVLREVFRELDMAKVARSRSILSGLFGDALFETRPLRDLLEQHIDQAFIDVIANEYRKGRGLWIATTNIDAQRPVIWGLGRIAASGHPRARELFIDVMIASAAIPGVFPPVMIDVEVDGERYDEMHVDGGATTQVFLYPASFSVRNFAQKNAARRERHLYVIRNARIDPVYKPVRRRTLPIAQRAVASLISSQGVGDLYRIYLLCLRDDIDFNLASIPREITADHETMFEATYIRNLFDAAYEQAARGYPWERVPPDFQSELLGTPGQVPADPSPTR
jgi:predicted acylesterase/phospholipase RssA